LAFLENYGWVATVPGRSRAA